MPQIMTPWQYAQAGLHMLHGALAARGLAAAPPRPYRPDYTACVDHFLVHAGAP